MVILIVPLHLLVIDEVPWRTHWWRNRHWISSERSVSSNAVNSMPTYKIILSDGDVSSLHEPVPSLSAQPACLWFGAFRCSHGNSTSLGCLSSLNNSDSLSLPNGEENYFYHSSYVSPPNIGRLPTGLAAKYHQHTKRTSHVCCWYCSLSPNSLLLALKCNIQPEFSSSAARDVAGFRTFGMRP